MSYDIYTFDQGHGGRDPGAIGLRGSHEQHFNFVLAAELENEMLAINPRVKIELLRDREDQTLGLPDRVKRINQLAQAHRVLNVSLHFNASTDSSANGIEVWFRDGNEPGRALAQKISSVGEKHGIKSRGAKTKHLYMTRKPKCDSILIEFGFLTNENDYTILQDKTKRRALLRDIAKILLA